MGGRGRLGGGGRKILLGGVLRGGGGGGIIVTSLWLTAPICSGARHTVNITLTGICRRTWSAC